MQQIEFSIDCLGVHDMNAGDVLSAFHCDAPYLFLRAAFAAVGFASAAFTALRPGRDPLRIFFSLLALLHGLGLWISSTLLGMTVHSAIFQTCLRPAINYPILIPAFPFFLALGLPRRFERLVGMGRIRNSVWFEIGGSESAIRVLRASFRTVASNPQSTPHRSIPSLRVCP